MVHTFKNSFLIEVVWLIFHPFLCDEHQEEHKDRSSVGGETESRWCFIAGVLAVLAALGILCWLCLKVQKVQSQNAVESLTSVPTPDTEQAAVTLVNYETGVTLLI